MKKTTKIALAGGLTFVTVSIGGLILAGNYLYDLALNKHKDKSAVFANPSTNNETKKSMNYSSKVVDENIFNTIDYQETKIESHDGLKLHGYEFSNSGHKYAIIVHGYTSQGKLMKSSASNFYRRGYNILVPDLRGHGQSEGDYIAMGWLDRLDIINWINYIIAKDQDAKIILYGVSMGAAAVMNVTGEKLPDNVVLAIEDCGFTSAWDMFSYQLNEMFSLPSHPFLDVANIVTQVRAGYSFGEGGAIEQVKKSTTPTLFIHGDKDKFVPYKMLEQLYEAANCSKEKLVVKNAGHAQCEEVGGVFYWKTIDRFIKKYQD